ETPERPSRASHAARGEIEQCWSALSAPLFSLARSSTLAVSALLVSHSSYTPDSDRWDQQLPARRCRRSVAPPQWRVRTAPALRLASFVRTTPAVTGRGERNGSPVSGPHEPWRTLPAARLPLPGGRDSGRRRQRGTQERGVEDPVGHHLAALHQPVLVGAVVGNRVVQRAEVIPDQHVVLGPVVGELILRLELVREQRLQHPIALRLVELVDADGVAGIA